MNGLNETDRKTSTEEKRQRKIAEWARKKQIVP